MSSDSGFEYKTHWFRCKTNYNLESYIRTVSDGHSAPFVSGSNLRLKTKKRGCKSKLFSDLPSPSKFVKGLQSSSVNIFLRTSSLLLLSFQLPCHCLSQIKVI